MDTCVGSPGTPSTRLLSPSIKENGTADGRPVLYAASIQEDLEHTG
jgi:hypothetical protein